MADKGIYNLHSEVLKALGNPMRLQIIEMLQKKEYCFSDILENTGTIKSTLSQHLSIMVNTGLLHVRKDSRCNYYKLSSAKVAKACSLLREVLIANHQKNKKIFESA